VAQLSDTRTLGTNVSEEPAASIFRVFHQYLTWKRFHASTMVLLEVRFLETDRDFPPFQSAAIDS
jgi:hypothetical protein